MPSQKKSSSNSSTLIPTSDPKVPEPVLSSSAAVPTSAPDGPDLLTDEAEQQEKKGGDKLIEELKGQQEKLQEYGMKINWDNITVDDLAILALLSAFLVVIAGPGAIALPVALAAFRTLSVKIGWELDDNGDLNKIDQKLGTSSNSPSKAQGQQLEEDRNRGATTAVA